MTVESRILPIFFHFLQNGFLLEARVGIGVGEFLRDRCRLSHETIADRIRTVFLNGKPVDDLECAIIENNATLALSGAMPGLVGAVMRSNSPLRSFRSSITHGGDKGSSQQQQGLVRLKLFNSVMSELGPALFEDGILLEPNVVKDFLTKVPVDRRRGFKQILLGGEPIDMRLMLDEEHLSGPSLVLLSVWTRE